MLEFGPGARNRDLNSSLSKTPEAVPTVPDSCCFPPTTGHFVRFWHAGPFAHRAFLSSDRLDESPSAKCPHTKRRSLKILRNSINLVKKNEMKEIRETKNLNVWEDIQLEKCALFSLYIYVWIL
ncbi:hypothetical protein GPALN_014815 [Globodera pallida]|nr:hypothetical protein GPALN_014815 [Globodera pallida]